MKRVKSACIFQTLVFSQKPDSGFSKERATQLNFEEVEHYKATLEKSKTVYRIVETALQEDGSVLVRVRKQYNRSTDASEYLD